MASAACEFIANRGLRGNRQFLQFLAFGFVLDSQRAVEAAQWFAESRSEHHASGNDLHNEFIADLLRQIVVDSVDRHRSGEVVLGLSGGFDSRAILTFLRRTGIAPLTYTFGQPGALDFDLVALLRQRMELRHITIDTSEADWQLEFFDRAPSRVQDMPISPRILAAELSERVAPEGVEFHGHLNNALAGSNLLQSPSGDWPSALKEFCSHNDPFSFQALMADQLAQLLPAGPLLSPDALSLDHQLDFAFRQMQRIRIVPFGTESRYVFPFEDRRWIGYWLRRPHDELFGQARYLAFLRSLDAEEFFDLRICKAATAKELRRERLAYLYGRSGLIDRDALPMAAPGGTGGHFSIDTCYLNNESFREMVKSSIRRLRNRCVFTESFIDGVVERLTRGDPKADRALNGLVTTDVAIEAGLFHI